jgi:hypothetical protein
MERRINHPSEKCLDCWNYKKIRRVWRCVFGLVPAIVGEGGHWDCVCHGYVDIKGREAPARNALLENLARLRDAKKE